MVAKPRNLGHNLGQKGRGIEGGRKMADLVLSPLVTGASNAVLAVGWGALLIAPAAHRACWLTARTCAMVLAAGWVVLALIAFGAGPPWQVWGPGWPTAMAQAPAAAALALIQFQAFNLFVASWQIEDGPRHAIPHVWLLPGLIATALSGPLGLVVHMAIRDGFKFRQARATGRAEAE
jgi:hypothetical protein